MSFGLVVCALQLRHDLRAHALDGSASKRGAFSASRNSSNASSWLSLSVRSEPRTIVAAGA